MRGFAIIFEFGSYEYFLQIWYTGDIWRYGQVVRQWIANPLPPVRIWVPPYKLYTIILFLNGIKIKILNQSFNK